ncbi:MAG: UDP-N-acetylmuramoyl-L-alanine--D-glutamate ligase [Marinilabiliales bacterium]|nr:MAG: UDP-N-acetylmuramoyl-L-alanine--D-glutamate ligase [Marinilabiliales bacterium]
MQSMIEYLKSVLESKKVLILGFGKEGRSTLEFLDKYLPEVDISIADANKDLKNDQLLSKYPESNLFFGDDYLNNLNRFDFIIKSPGVNLRNALISPNTEVSSQTSLFLDFYHNQVIGVTGTKGKSTTSSLIYFLLQKLNKKSVLLGNIGKPAFNSIKGIDEDTIIVYELSAHQLESIKTSPKVAVLLNIFPEHLDYFTNFESYANAKFNIIKFQTKDGSTVINKKLITKDLINGKTLSFGLESNNNAFIEGEKIVFVKNGIRQSFNCNNLKIKGTHNWLNVMAAVLSLNETGIAIDDILQYLNKFKSLPHRLEFIGEFSGVKFYNDSISTVPESTIEAIKTLGKIDTLLLGGFDRGIDYSILADYLMKTDVNNLIFMGKAGGRILNLLITRGVDEKKINVANNLEEAFLIIKSKAKIASICLLSPAASSYDKFKNFEHRGDFFRGLAASFSR